VQVTTGSVSFATKQPQVDCFRHRVVAQIVRVDMVAAVIFRSQTGRLYGIAQNRVEIDDRIVRAAGANLDIDRLALLFHGRRPEAWKRKIFYREESPAVYAQAHRPCCLVSR
jgi:hypothetical protein